LGPGGPGDEGKTGPLSVIYREATEVLHKYRTSYRTHSTKIPYILRKKNTVHTVHSPVPVPYIPKILLKKSVSIPCTHTKKI